MKVALVGPYPVELDKIPGGVAAVTYYLAQGLARQPDIDLHVIAATRHAAKDTVVHMDNISVHYLSYPKARAIPNQYRDIGRIRGVLREIVPDIVHSQTPSGTDAAAQAGIPCVMTIHGIPDQERRFAKGLSNRLGAAIAPWFTRRALRKADAGIAISPYVIEAYRELDTLPWYSINNPIEDRFFEISGREVPNKLLFAGVMYERKNIPGLIRAFHLVYERNAKAELFICGKVLDPGIFVAAQQYVDKHHLGNCVHLLGFVSQDELTRHFAEAAILCLFSEEETAPMIIAQAMCAGKPVVSTAAGGVPYLMSDQETGYVVPIGDERAFADRVLELLADETLRQRMGQRGRQLANSQFRTDSIVRQTIDVYQAVLANRKH